MFLITLPLVLNVLSSWLCLLSSWHYRNVSPCLASYCLFFYLSYLNLFKLKLLRHYRFL
jgi:hypothetical protein